MKLTLKSPAKINLTLDVLGRSPDIGYHFVNTIMQTISLYDLMEFESDRNGKVTIECDDSEIPVNEQNLAFQAVKAMQKESQLGLGMRIKIKKHIPVGAGLGGGSSNAATTLKACNTLWDLHYSLERLAKIGADIGVDVPFFVYGKTGYGTNFGENIEILEPLADQQVVIVYPGEPSLTGKMYELLDLSLCGQNNNDTRRIMRGEESALSQLVHNDFETLLVNEDWDLGVLVQQIKDDLLANGANAACMSGSGSAVFGIFTDNSLADQAVTSLKKHYDFVAQTTFC